jgi:hypothetical protein
MDRALRTSEGLGRLQGQGLQRQQLGLANEMAKANFDYLPQQRQMAQDEFQLKERIGNAQIQHLMAQAQAAQREKDPAYQFKELMRMYQASKDDTPEKLYYGELLNNMMGTGGGAGMKVPGVTGASGSSAGGGQLGAKTGPNGGILNQGTVSSRSNRGMEYTVQNDDGTVTTYASPTMGNETQQQNRLAAQQEAHVLLDPVLKGIAPYQGDIFQRNSRFMKDVIASKLGDKSATERLGNYARALSLKPEAAATVGRMATGGGQVGIEMMNELGRAQARNIPGEFLNNMFLPAEALEKSNSQYLDTQSKGVDAAVGAGRNNYPMNPQEAPRYAQGSDQPVFRFTGSSARDSESMANMRSQKVQSNSSDKKESTSGWGNNGYVHSDGKTYTRAELEKIARGGK